MIMFEDEKYQIFDIHTHWSKLMSKILRKPLENLSNNEILDQVFGSWWNEIKKNSKSKNELKFKMFVRVLDYYGIDKSVVLPVFLMDVKFLKQCEEAFPGRVIGFGAVKPVQKEDKVIAKLDDLYKKGYKGLKLHAEYNDFNVKIHSKEISRVLNYLGEHNMIALFHTGSHFDIRDLNPILKNNPEVKVVLGHSGLCSQVDQAIECAIKNPNIYLETSGQGYQYMIETAVKHKDIGVGRILYGSDLPTLDPNVEMMKILSLTISEHEKQAIFWDNAQSLFE